MFLPTKTEVTFHVDSFISIFLFLLLPSYAFNYSSSYNFYFTTGLSFLLQLSRFNLCLRLKEMCSTQVQTK